MAWKDWKFEMSCKYSTRFVFSTNYASSYTNISRRENWKGQFASIFIDLLQFSYINLRTNRQKNLTTALKVAIHTKKEKRSTRKLSRKYFPLNFENHEKNASILKLHWNRHWKTPRLPILRLLNREHVVFNDGSVWLRPLCNISTACQQTAMHVLFKSKKKVAP